MADRCPNYSRTLCPGVMRVTARVERDGMEYVIERCTVCRARRNRGRRGGTITPNRADPMEIDPAPGGI